MKSFRTKKEAEEYVLSSEECTLRIFQEDVNAAGAKRFLLGTYEEAFDKIFAHVGKPTTAHLYEDYNLLQSTNGVPGERSLVKHLRLFADYDDAEFGNTNPTTVGQERARVAKLVAEAVGTLLYQQYDLQNVPVMILYSDSLDKVSLHFIWNVYFETLADMKAIFLQLAIPGIDLAPFSAGRCMRMGGCSKLGKNNILRTLFNYNWPYRNSFEYFTHSLLTFRDPNAPLLAASAPSHPIHRQVAPQDAHPFYYHMDDTTLKRVHAKLNSLHKVSSNVWIYLDWFKITMAMKDLYNHVKPEWTTRVRDAWHDWDKQGPKYDAEADKRKFDNEDPDTITIDYLDSHYSKDKNENYGVDIKIVRTYRDVLSTMFTPTDYRNIIQRDERFIDKELVPTLLQNDLIFIKSPCGTGKTTLIAAIHEAIHGTHANTKPPLWTSLNRPDPTSPMLTISIPQECSRSSTLSIVSRVNLAEMHADAFGLYSYKDKVALNNFRYHLTNRFVTQLDSLAHFDPTYFYNGLLILDEVASLLAYFRSTTLSAKRKSVYHRFVEAVQHARYIVALDADLNDMNIRLIQDIRRQPPIVQESDFLPWNPQPRTMADNLNDNTVVYHNTFKNRTGIKATVHPHDSDLVALMKQYLTNNKPFVACFDSLRAMKGVLQELEACAAENAIDHSTWLKYSSEHQSTDIDTSKWADNCVFYSPSILYGIDFSVATTAVFAFVMKSTLTPLQIYQQISRSRLQEGVHVYVKEGATRPRFPTLIHTEQYVQRMVDSYETLTASAFASTYDEELDHFDAMVASSSTYRLLYTHNLYYDSRLKSNMRAYLIQILEENGYEVEVRAAHETSTTSLQTIARAPKEQDIKRRMVILGLCHESEYEFMEKLAELDAFTQRLVTSDSAFASHFALKLLDGGREAVNAAVVNDSSRELLEERAIRSTSTKLLKVIKVMEALDIAQLEDIKPSLFDRYKQPAVALSEILHTVLFVANPRDDVNLSAKKYTVEALAAEGGYYLGLQMLMSMLKQTIDKGMPTSHSLFSSTKKRNSQDRSQTYSINADILQKHRRFYQIRTRVEDLELLE